MLKPHKVVQNYIKTEKISVIIKIILAVAILRETSDVCLLDEDEEGLKYLSPEVQMLD